MKISTAFCTVLVLGVFIWLIVSCNGCTTPHNDHYEANVDLPPDWMQK